MSSTAPDETYKATVSKNNPTISVFNHIRELKEILHVEIAEIRLPVALRDLADDAGYELQIGTSTRTPSSADVADWKRKGLLLPGPFNKLTR